MRPKTKPPGQDSTILRFSALITRKPGGECHRVWSDRTFDTSPSGPLLDPAPPEPVLDRKNATLWRCGTSRIDLRIVGGSLGRISGSSLNPFDLSGSFQVDLQVISKNEGPLRQFWGIWFEQNAKKFHSATG
ncbi:hypothetical protein N7510_009560 [Penicillium lagena]|uniref:uncharacterized protein n=1 Tax=Penicillium lagena TaxID=94218 RepID=UPI00253F7ED2|nr:uncharacterized protein N7510_009560 [Penicillium lagena]KAJ5604406.1 hypothetical protein N7510_009560 [Penicillium lagena]